MKSYRGTLAQCGWCPYEKRRLGHRHTQRDSHVRTWRGDDHLHAKGPGPEQTYPAPHGLLLPSLLLSAPANVLSGLCWCSLTSASIFQLEPSFKALLERHHLQTSSRIPPRWKQFPPPLNILRCLCFSYCSPHAYLLLHKHFCLCLTSPTGRELLES